MVNNNCSSIVPLYCWHALELGYQSWSWGIQLTDRDALTWKDAVFSGACWLHVCHESQAHLPNRYARHDGIQYQPAIWQSTHL
jgi:hypothetical protein